MPTVNFKLAPRGPCAGGGHVPILIALNGGQAREVVYTTDELRRPLGSLSRDEHEAGALYILMVRFAGMTRAQMRTALEALGGVDVVI